MTTRRDFLGIMAAAPLFAPAIAQSVTVAQYAGGEVIGVGHWESCIVGDAGPESLFTPNQMRAFEHELYGLAERLPNEKLRALLRSPSPWDEPLFIGVDMGSGDDTTYYFIPTPNRLHGAYINERGEAV